MTCKHVILAPFSLRGALTKVFLEVWNLFLQKKVPRLERSVITEGEAVKSKKGTIEEIHFS